MHSKCPRPALAFIGAMILMSARDCLAAKEGDIELLRLVATAHQANRARINTWQGHADIESTLADAN
jgi:hypothetical protein